MSRCLAIHDKLEASLRDLSRTGDAQACKAARKAADSSLKELSKELKSLLGFLQSSPQPAQILPKVIITYVLLRLLNFCMDHTLVSLNQVLFQDLIDRIV